MAPPNTETTTIDINSTTLSSTVLSNSTEVTTTPMPSTTLQTENNDTKGIEKTVVRSRGHLNTSDYNCGCDVTLNICDTNCCCDIDCTNEMLIAFDCTKTEVNLADYYFGYGLQHCAIDNSLFCIETNNYGDEKMMVTHHQHRKVYTWPEEIPVHITTTFDIEHEYYTYGSPLLFYDPKKDAIETIDLPGACHIRESIKFLDDKSVKCVKSISDVFKANTEFLVKLKRGKIFKKPLKSLSNAKDSDFLSITIKICKYSVENCTTFMFNESSTEVEEIHGYDECFQDLLISFNYNLTSLESATIYYISYDNFLLNDDLEDQSSKIIQKVKVEFENFNQEVYHNLRKNLRGYKDLEPLRATRLILLNETRKDQPRILEYFHKNLTVSDLKNFTLKIPNSRAGRCVLGRNSDTIKFNENSLTMCKVFYSMEGEGNATDFCRGFQKEIIKYLFVSLNLTDNYTSESFQDHAVVSKHWNSRNDTKYWTRVNLQNLPGSKVEVETSNEQIICKNLVSSLKYSIYFKKLKHESTIERVDAEFGGFANTKVKIDAEKEIKIKIFVKFFPASFTKSSAQIFNFDAIFIFLLSLSSCYFLNLLINL